MWCGEPRARLEWCPGRAGDWDYLDMVLIRRALEPKVPYRVHPFHDVLVLGRLGAPLHHQEGRLEQEGHEQRGEHHLHLRALAGLQQQLVDGPGGLGQGGHR